MKGNKKEGRRKAREEAEKRAKGKEKVKQMKADPNPAHEGLVKYTKSISRKETNSNSPYST